MSYIDALRIVAQDTGTLCGESPEYERGQLELLADLHPRPLVERGVRVIEIKDDVFAIGNSDAAAAEEVLAAE